MEQHKQQQIPQIGNIKEKKECSDTTKPKKEELFCKCYYELDDNEIESRLGVSMKLINEKLQQHLKTEWDRMWTERFRQLLSYKACFDNININTRDTQLGLWIGRQRTQKRLGKLHPDRIMLLESINFDWRVQVHNKPRNPPVARILSNESFDSMMVLVEKFVKEHGHCRIPLKYGKDTHGLGKWAANRRFEKKRNKLSCERVKKLNEIGFAWEMNPGRKSKTAYKCS